MILFQPRSWWAACSWHSNIGSPFNIEAMWYQEIHLSNSVYLLERWWGCKPPRMLSVPQTFGFGSSWSWCFCSERHLFSVDETKLAHGRRCPRHRATTSQGLWRKESPERSHNPLQPPTKERELRIIFVYHRLGSALMVVLPPPMKGGCWGNPKSWSCFGVLERSDFEIGLRLPSVSSY